MTARRRRRPAEGGLSTPVGRELDSDPSSWSAERAAGAFAGLMESARNAKFTPAEFWRRIGKTGEHSAIIRKSILHVNAITAALIKEFEK